MVISEFKSLLEKTIKEEGKLALIKVFNDIFKKGLKASKELADTINFDFKYNPEQLPESIDVVFNRIWKQLSKEDKTNLRKFKIKEKTWFKITGIIECPKEETSTSFFDKLDEFLTANKMTFGGSFVEVDYNGKIINSNKK